MTNIIKKHFPELDKILDHVPYPIFWKDTNSRYLGCNRKFANDLDLECSTIVGKTDLDLGVEDAEKYIRSDQKILQTGKGINNQKIKIRNTDQNTRTFELSKGPIKNQSGEVIGIIGSYVDITEKEQTEEELLKSELKFKSVFKAAPVGIGLVSNRVVGWTNDLFSSIVGYSNEELYNMEAIKLYPSKEEYERAGNKKHKEIKSYGVGSVETQLKRKDGQIIDVLVSFSTIEDNKNCDNLVFTVIDLSEYKKQEAQNRQLATAVEQASESIYITEKDGHIVYANPAFEMVSGYKISEVLGKRPTILHSGKHSEDYYNDMELCISSGNSWHGQIINKNKKGDFYREDLTVTPVKEEKGSIINYVAVGRDVTLETDLHEQLTQAQRLESIGRLAGGIAHDFNNLLTAIVGNTELALLTLPSDAKCTRELKEINKTVDRASDLIRQLLAFSRKQVFTPRVINLNDVINSMNRMLHRVIGEDIELKTELNKKLWNINVDPSQVEQIIMNMAVNARDAMPDGGKLTIETSNIELDEEYALKHIQVEPGNYVLTVISDTGIGMDENIKNMIFEPFFTTKDKSKGTGLGLSTVFGIIRQNGGFIWVYSEPDMGSSFKIYLPATKANINDIISSKKKSQHLEGTESILVVEDEKQVRNIIHRSLKTYGYNVYSADSGETALKLLNKRDLHPDMILSDVVMPNMNGPELVSIIQEDLPNIPVLFMSGYAENSIVQNGVLSKKVNFISKPFKTVNLLIKIREILNSREISPSNL